MTNRAALLIFLCSPPLFAGQEEPERRGIEVGDLARISQVLSIDVADDGSAAVFLVRSIDGELGDRDAEPPYRTHLHWIDLEQPNAASIQLTFGARSAASPALSPDGKSVAFARLGEEDAAGDGGGRQVWILRLDQPGEARQVTTLEHGVGAPRWRPDGKALLVSSPVPASELEEPPPFDAERPGRTPGDADVDDEESEVDEEGKEGEAVEEAPPLDGSIDELRRWLHDGAEEDEPYVIHRLDFTGERGLAGEESFTQLFLVDLESGDEEIQLTSDYRNQGGARWSPDGESIYFVDRPRTAIHPDRALRQAIFVMRADGSSEEALLDSEMWTYSGPRIASDGKTLLFGAQATDEPTFAQRRLGRLDLASGESTLLLEDFPTDIGGVTPLEDGALLFRAPWQGYQQLHYFDPARNEARVVFESGSVGALDSGGGRTVFAASTASNPFELYVLEPDGTTRRLTDLHTSWLEGVDVVTPVERWTDNSDGTRVQYWVMPPTDFEPGRSYPTVLEMHGGPHVMWGPGSFSMWHEFQLLCSRGYGVVYANPRGSGGYGEEFQRGNYRDWGTGPASDVLAALDAAIAEFEWIDEDRLFATGGSYAGYLTAWVVAHDHRFRAAVAQRGVYDLATFFGEGNAWRLVEWSFGGLPWEPEVREILLRESPFTHVADIRTPLLIMHGSRDLRTGVSQSEMMYRALKELERPVEYVRYPEGDHELSRSGPPNQRVDRLLRIVEFFERWADNDDDAPANDE